MVVKLRASQPLLCIEGLADYCIVSQDPNNYADAPTEGIRRILERVLEIEIPRGSVLPTDKIGAHARPLILLLARRLTGDSQRRLHPSFNYRGD